MVGYPNNPYFQQPVYNPYMATQQRLQGLEQQQYQQMQPIQQTTQIPQQQPSQLVQARAVASREEALLVPVDYSGNVMILTDISHGKIYTKSFNTQTGSSNFSEYARVEDAPKEEKKSDDKTEEKSDYVTHKELDEILDSLTGGKK